MPTLTQVQDAIYAWVAAVPDVPTVLWAHRAAPQPDGEFITLRIERIASQGVDWFVVDAGAGDTYSERIEGPRTISLRIQVLAYENGSELLHKILAWAGFDTIRTALNTAGVSFLSIEPVLEVGAWNIDEYAGRAETTVTLAYVHSISTGIEIIESVIQEEGIPPS